VGEELLGEERGERGREGKGREGEVSWFVMVWGLGRRKDGWRVEREREKGREEGERENATHSERSPNQLPVHELVGNHPRQDCLRRNEFESEQTSEKRRVAL